MNETNITSETTKMTVSETMKANLISSAKWAKFLLIIQCIGVGVLVLASCMMFTIMREIGIGIGVLWLLLAAIMLYPIIKGFGFANKTTSACLTDNESVLSCAFADMHAVLRFYGIITIVYIVVCIVLIGGAIAGATSMAGLM